MVAGIPHAPRGSLNRLLTPETSEELLCLTSGVRHPQAFKFEKKWELFSTIFYLTKNPDSNFLRFSQNLWRRYIL